MGSAMGIAAYFYAYARGGTDYAPGVVDRSYVARRLYPDGDADAVAATHASGTVSAKQARARAVAADIHRYLDAVEEVERLERLIERKEMWFSGGGALAGEDDGEDAPELVMKEMRLAMGLK
jgi:hypothetical protein